MNTLALYRNRIARSLDGCRLAPSLSLCLFEDGYCLDIFGFLIALPFLDRWVYEPNEMMERWGIYLSDGVGRGFAFESIVLCWGDYCKFIHMPWEWKHYKTEVLRPDGTWAKRVASYEKGEPDGRQYWHLPYRYTLKSGEVQDRIASVYVERKEWRRKWTMWCPWFAKVRKDLWIEFSDEVGEQTGSWKGGTVGCGWKLLPGESVENAVRRMERERKFP